MSRSLFHNDGLKDGEHPPFTPIEETNRGMDAPHKSREDGGISCVLITGTEPLSSR